MDIVQSQQLIEGDIDFASQESFVDWHLLLKRASILPPFYWSHLNSSWIATSHEAVRTVLESKLFGRNPPFLHQVSGTSVNKWPVFAKPQEHERSRTGFLLAIGSLPSLQDWDAHFASASLIIRDAAGPTGIELSKDLVDRYVGEALQSAPGIPAQDFLHLRNLCRELDCAFNVVRPSMHALSQAETALGALVEYFQRGEIGAVPDDASAQEVNAALANPVVAHALNIEINSATLKIDRLVHNREGAPVHYVTVWTAPMRTRLVMEVAADDIDGYNVGRLLHDVQQPKVTRRRQP